MTKKIIQRGVDNERPRTGQMCTVKYTTRLVDDESVLENIEDLQFILGDGDVVPAFDISVSLMNLNEESEIYAEPRHTYEEKGK